MHRVLKMNKKSPHRHWDSSSFAGCT